MSAHNCSADLGPKALNEAIHTTPEQGSLALTGKRKRRDGLCIKIGQGLINPLSELLRECWRRIGFMKATFEHGGLTRAESDERREGRRHHREAWSRMDEEGCPNEGPQPWPVPKRELAVRGAY